MRQYIISYLHMKIIKSDYDFIYKGVEEGNRKRYFKKVYTTLIYINIYHNIMV